MLKKLAAIVAGLVVAFTTVSNVHAQGINIDFEWPLGSTSGPGAGVPANTFGGAANQPGAWNRIFQTPNPVNLNGLDAAFSGVTMTRSPAQISHSGSDSANTTGEHNFLFDDFWNIDNGPATAEFFGLNAGWYEVYTYAITPNGSICRTRVEIPGAETPSEQVSGGVMPVNNFAQGITHTKHRIFIPNENTSLKINISNFANSCIAVGGIQIKPVAPCPDVNIDSPDNFACICDTEIVRGDVTIAPPGNVAFWYTQYRALSAMNWTLIDVGFNTGNNINLGTFDATALTQGYYFIKTTAISGDGCFDEDTHIVWVDKVYDALDMTYPVTGGVYGGIVCAGGIVDDVCPRYYTIQWAPLPAGAPFSDIDPGTPFYFAEFPIVGTWAGWDTIAAGVPDGEYVFRVDATDNCGHTASDDVRFIVDNTPPVADIISPENCSFVRCNSLVSIKGTACDTNLAGWTVQVTGGPYNSWVTIASGNTCVQEDLLAVWDTTGLPNCAYSIRVLVTDSSILNCNGAISHLSEDVVSINIGLQGDVNGDGEINFADVTAVLNSWGATCN